VFAQALPHWLGHDVDANRIENWFGRFWTVIYFGFFAFVWAYTRFGLEKTKPVPERLTSHA
jgi:ubiquinol-cytochrome c reductase cytochrome b subunit